MLGERAAALVAAAVLCAAGCAGGAARGAGDPADAAEAQAASILRAADQRIGPEDLLEVSVFEAEELSRSVRVSGQGEISLPLLGVVRAAGLTARELETVLRDRLREDYILDPHVSVQILEVRSRSVYVLGEVEQPGAFPMTDREPMTVLQALALGSGLRPTAAEDRALIIRRLPDGGRTEIPVDLEKVVAGEAADPPLQPNDILFVPNSSMKTAARGVVDALVRMVSLRGIFR